MLLALTLGLGAESAKFLYQHPVYNLPVYAHQPLTHAVTPKKAVTTYAKKENVHFSSIMCQVDHREVAKLWDAFDLNTDGLIGFNDINSASTIMSKAGIMLDIIMPEVKRRVFYEMANGENTLFTKVFFRAILLTYHALNCISLPRRIKGSEKREAYVCLLFGYSFFSC